ncbi:unnamed protein product [marine sediment metagenome]|uniref:Uncharacterized protein n=1 Tax=marine sediment metagenome TaxID=412755 RepID=X0TKG0_9ZZZZ
MRSVDEAKARKCPRTYLKWSFVVAGMVFAFFVYLVSSNVMTDASDLDVSEAGQTGAASSDTARNVILTEHINEEDDYEKPVCKRLEESGERY